MYKLRQCEVRTRYERVETARDAIVFGSCLVMSNEARRVAAMLIDLAPRAPHTPRPAPPPPARAIQIGKKSHTIQL